jgi:diamine N-acetyltransferase
LAGPFIRRGRREDAAALAEFAERTFRATFDAHNNPNDMAEYCRSAYSEEIQRRQLLDPAMDTLLVVDETDRLIAYAQLRPGAPAAVTGPSPIELWRFYLDAAHHGRGIAHRLLAAVEDAARARQARTLWLGVWEHNARARAFYRKVGFVDVGAHTFVLGSDLQTDLLMARPLDRDGQ